MRAALWRSQRGAEPPRARSGEACGARGTGRSLRRGEAARRPQGRGFRAPAQVGGWCGGLSPRLSTGSGSERPAQPKAGPRTCAKPDILWAKPETGLRSKLAQNVVLRRCGWQGTAGRLGSPPSPDGELLPPAPRERDSWGSRGPQLARGEKRNRGSGHRRGIPKIKTARVVVAIRALFLLYSTL